MKYLIMVTMYDLHLGSFSMLLSSKTSFLPNEENFRVNVIYCLNFHFIHTN
jgi:hypothetical protein